MGIFGRFAAENKHIEVGGKRVDMKEKFLGEIGKKALIDKVYDDVFHPVLSEVGCSLQGIARVLLAPIAALSWSYNKISAYLDKTISKYFEERKILGEKIELTGSDIAVMDIGTLCFVDEGVIKEISGNKSEVSMKLKTANFVAPSFADIIEQLTPGEVIIVMSAPGKCLLNFRKLSFPLECTLKVHVTLYGKAFLQL